MLLIHSMGDYNDLLFPILFFFPLMVTNWFGLSFRFRRVIVPCDKNRNYTSRIHLLNVMNKDKEMKQIKICLCALTKYFNSGWFWKFRRPSGGRRRLASAVSIIPTHYQPRLLVTGCLPGFFHKNLTRREENRTGGSCEG